MSGWDRIRFRGTVRWLASTRGLATYLGKRGMMLKDFGNRANEITKKVRLGCALQAKLSGMPMMYLRTPRIDKEGLARQIAKERGVDTGDICMFSCVEPCLAPQVRGNRSTRQLEIQMGHRKCVHIYHYWNDPILGFGHTRLQTWLPLSCTICINGRHWLERQLMREAVGYVKDRNSFSYISDIPRDQELLDEQLRSNWPHLLNGLLVRNCPSIHGMFGRCPLYYY